MLKQESRSREVDYTPMVWFQLIRHLRGLEFKRIPWILGLIRACVLFSAISWQTKRVDVDNGMLLIVTLPRDSKATYICLSSGWDPCISINGWWLQDTHISMQCRAYYVWSRNPLLFHLLFKKLFPRVAWCVSVSLSANLSLLYQRWTLYPDSSDLTCRFKCQGPR